MSGPNEQYLEHEETGVTRQPLRALTTATAQELREYILLSNDLRTSFSTMKLWFDNYADSPSDIKDPIGPSLFRDSIIMFVGCFDNSASVSLSISDIYKDADGGLEFFAWLKDIRDSYAAHKFGPLRQCAVGVILDDNGMSVGTGFISHIYQGPEKSGKDSILRFISIAGRYLDSKIEQLWSLLKEEISAMDRADLEKLETARLHGVNPEHIRMTRSRFERKIMPQFRG